MKNYWMIIKFPEGTTINEIKAFGFDILTDKNCDGVFTQDDETYPRGIDMREWFGPSLILRIPDVEIKRYIQKKYDLVNENRMRTFTFRVK